MNPELNRASDDPSLLIDTLSADGVSLCDNQNQAIALQTVVVEEGMPSQGHSEIFCRDP